jgi:predicted alpha/beta superfamily hydrolase
MVKVVGAIVLMCLTFIQSSAQTNGIDNVIGENHKIQSEILDEERDIQIYLPPSYTNSNDQLYPVVYMLDGQEYFLTGVAHQQMLLFQDLTPEYIVVGINTNRQKRRSLFYSESDKFIGFLDRELIPFIDAHYRTMKNNERIFFGWEMAGGLGLEIFGDYQGLFSAFIIASPSHAERRFESLKNPKSGDAFLLVTAAEEEHWILGDTTFIATIKNINPPKTRFSVLPREDHHSTPFKTIHEGLQDYFSDYKPIKRSSLKAYEDYGGLSALKQYFKNRGERYGLATEIDSETRHFLFFYCERENNFQEFERFVGEFPDHLASYRTDFWMNRFGHFYLKHEQSDKAISLFKNGLDKFPESARLHKGLADAYLTNNNKARAIASYRNALSIDPDMQSAIEALQQLETE